MRSLDATLIAEEDQLWHELHATMDSFTPDQALVPGYYPEGWSAKDALAHIDTWLADAGVAWSSSMGVPPSSSDGIRSTR
jgi:hypothetical protein